MKICSKCGASIDSASKFCSYCGASLEVESPSRASVEAQPAHREAPKAAPCEKPYDNLAFAVFAFVFTPFGIPALINATRVDEYWYGGEYDKAIAAAKAAKKWSKISLIAGCAIIGVTIMLVFCVYLFAFLGMLLD